MEKYKIYDNKYYYLDYVSLEQLHEKIAIKNY